MNVAATPQSPAVIDGVRYVTCTRCGIDVHPDQVRLGVVCPDCVATLRRKYSRPLRIESTSAITPQRELEPIRGNSVFRQVEGT